MAEFKNIIDEKELATSVAVTLIEDTAKGAWGKVKKFFKDLNAQDSIIYGTAYETYLKNVTEKYRKIKTIIYRHSPRDIYSFYVPMNIRLDVRKHHRIMETQSLSEFLEIGHKILLTGTGGIGKSMMSRYLFLNTNIETDYIPVLVELRGFNNFEIKDISLYNEIFRALTNNGFSLEKEYFEYSMKEGAYVIFLDGYDEVNRDRYQKITDEIKSLSSKYKNNYFVVSSRPSREFIGWNDFNEARIRPLNKEQALELIRKIDFDPNIKETFCQQLDKQLYDKYESFASNPLLLNIMLLTFQKHASIPDRLNDFYDEAFVTLFNVHDATKDSYVRDIRCGLGCEDFKLIFAYICFKSYFRDVYQFTETTLREYIAEAKNKFPRISFDTEDFRIDLLSSVCMLVVDGLNYHFAHRSFQEFFAAWYTCKLLDDEQSRLLLHWIRESPNVLGDSYLTMLYDLQSEKVNKIVIIPILKEIQRAYNSYGYSIELLQMLFEGITWKKRPKPNGKAEYQLSFRIKDQYLCRGLILNTRLNDPKIYKQRSSSDAEISLGHKLKKKYPEFSDRHFESISFEQVLTVVSVEEFLDAVSWIKDDIDFAMKTIADNENTAVSRKRKVASILDEL